MTINSTEYLTSIGLDSVYIAEVTQDDSSAYVAGTPVYLAPVAELSGAPKVTDETLYYDNQAFESLLSEGVTERKLKISALPSEMEALLTGEKFDSASGRIYDSSTPSASPYFALGYRTMKSNGHYQYVWFLKGRFMKPANDHATVGEKAEAKPIELTYNAVKTIHQFNQGTRTDGVKRIKGDADTTNFVATTWFSAVQTPSSASPDALTCTPVPADGEAAFPIANNLTFTFSNQIRSGSTGVILSKIDGAIVAGVFSWNAGYTVLTFNPNASLTNSATYLITLSGVTDIYGQVLADTVYNFTCVGA